MIKTDTLIVGADQGILESTLGIKGLTGYVLII